MSENNVRPQDTKERDRQAVAIDYETYYDSKSGYSLSAMSPQLYCADERFDAYLVAICGWEIMGDSLFERWRPGNSETGFRVSDGAMVRKLPDGRQLYVGRPENFGDWDNLRGRILIAHNAAFDSVVTDELARRGMIPSWLDSTRPKIPPHDFRPCDADLTDPPEWKCTADLSAYLMVPRNLKGAMKELYGKEISKAVRAGMDGRHDYDLNPEERRALVEYGGSDAVECHDIWLDHSAEWPDIERAISDQKRDATKRGIMVDRKLAEDSLKELKRYHANVVCDVPWYPEKPVGSLPALRQAVIALGLMPPPSFKKDDPRFLEWIERPVARYDDAVRRGYEILDDFYEEVHHPEVRENSGMNGSPSAGNERVLHRAYTERVHLAHIAATGELAFLKARQKAVAINMHAARVEGILASLDRDGASHPAFLYFGAHTGRDSGKSSTGGSNTNMLNMPRKPVLQGDEHVFGGKGIDIRGMYVARPGHKFVVYDYSQIEARFSLWLVDDTHMMEAMKREGNLYQANAVMMGWCEPGEKIKKEKPDVYRLAKCCVLGLGYGMGAAKFVDSCKSQGLELPPVPVEHWPEIDRRLSFIIRNVARVKGDPYSERNQWKVGQLIKSLQIVSDWRNANSKIVAKWREYEQVFKERIAAGKSTVAFRLPSGRIKRYFDPHLCKEETVEVDENGKEHPSFRIAIKATTVRGNPATFFTGGNIMENIVQASCRDIMAYSAVEVERKHPSWRYVFSVYDEIVFEVPEPEAEEANAEIPRIMTKGDYIKDWTDGLALEVEGDVCDRYHK